MARWKQLQRETDVYQMSKTICHSKLTEYHKLQSLISTRQRQFYLYFFFSVLVINIIHLFIICILLNLKWEMTTRDEKNKPIDAMSPCIREHFSSSFIIIRFYFLFYFSFIIFFYWVSMYAIVFICGEIWMKSAPMKYDT